MNASILCLIQNGTQATWLNSNFQTNRISNFLVSISKCYSLQLLIGLAVLKISDVKQSRNGRFVVADCGHSTLLI